MIALVRSTFVFAWLAVLTVAAGEAAPDRKVQTFGELTVSRLNVVEEDGKPRFVVSSREHMPNAFWRGKEYRHRSHGSGGLLFFNDDGTEAGGMGFGAARNAQGYSAGSNLNFDQYEQDNTLQLLYEDENGERIAGMRVKDRPDLSLLPLLELVDARAGASSDAERERIAAEMQAMEKKHAGTAERFFGGKERGQSVLRLADGEGRARLVLKVDERGEPGVEFLDASGKVVRRIAGAQ